MDKATGTVFSPPQTKKALARVALVGIQDSARIVLSECFRQFGIETVIMTDNAADRLKREKFEACVIRLSPETEAVLESARTSPSNNRMVIYGVGGTVQDAMRYSRYGINAVFNEPIERPSALKLVRATQMLVLHEFRRYVRIPVITEVSVALSRRPLHRPAARNQLRGDVAAERRRRCARPLCGDFLRIADPAAHLGTQYGELAHAWQQDLRSAIRCPGRAPFASKEWIDSYLEN